MLQQEYKIITLVKGLQSPIQREKLIANMKRENKHIFGQETHLVQTEHEKLKKLLFEKTFYSFYSKGNARGVAMLISNKMAFQLSSQIIDKEERYVLVKSFLDSREVTLHVVVDVDIYRPPGQHTSLIKKLFYIIATEITCILICRRVWNVQLHPTFQTDSTNPTKRTNPEENP